MSERVVIEKLIEKGLTLGSVESFTGGLFAATVVSFSGVSAIFKGALVTYQNEIKMKLAGVKAETLEKFGSVSSVVALEMVRGGKKKLGVDFCLAFTGYAEKGSGKEKGGEVYIALKYGEDEIVEHHLLKGNRNKVRSDAVTQAFKILARVLENY